MFIIASESELPLLRNFFIELPTWWHGHGPVELVSHGFREDFLDWDLIAFAPSNGNTWVHIVELQLGTDGKVGELRSKRGRTT